MLEKINLIIGLVILCILVGLTFFGRNYTEELRVHFHTYLEPEKVQRAIADQRDMEALEPLFKAMLAVEGGEPGISGMDGERGPLQIKKIFWEDSDTPGSWEMCDELEYSKKVAFNYWKRWAPLAVKERDFFKLARIFNGGPNGHLKKSTLEYARRVERLASKYATQADEHGSPF